MPRPTESVSASSRRTLLRAVGLTTIGGLSMAAAATDHDAEGSDGSTHDGSTTDWALVQGDRCIPITPLSGDVPVEELYDYTYPQDRYEGPPGSDGDSFSSAGTTALQRDNTSILFLYDGPEGMSLVVVHGHLDGETDNGGAVTFQFTGLPSVGDWIVRDDYYLEDGEPADSNHDRWDGDGQTYTVDWTYQSSRTDGGAFRGLGDGDTVHIDPAFNDAASLSGVLPVGPIERWELLSGESTATDRHQLDLDTPVTIQSAQCSDDDDHTETPDEEETDGDSAEETTDNGESETEDDTTSTQQGEDGSQQRTADRDGDEPAPHERGDGEKRGHDHSNGNQYGHDKETGPPHDTHPSSNGNGNDRGNGHGNGNGRGNGNDNGRGNGR